LNDLLIDLRVVSCRINIILGFVQLFFQFEFNFSLLHKLLMQLSFSSVVCSCDVLLFLGFLLFEFFQFTLGLRALSGILSLLFDRVHNLLDNFPLLLLKVCDLPIELLHLRVHFSLIQLEIFIRFLQYHLAVLILFNEIFDALNDFVI
jgi:hypothetical protein